jgi:putative ABC transport system ATP-binding protein
LIVLRDIYKTYRFATAAPVHALQGVSLNIAAGELVAIMGPSGSGKTTLMNIVGLLDQPTSGKYILDNKAIEHCTDDELAGIRNRKIGFVFQSFYLLPRLTALENVGYPLIYRGMPRKVIQQRSLAMLAKLGMAGRAQHRPNELSGGQQQRVAIARALIGSPAIILADEPTGALDSQVSNEIMELFTQLNQQEGITVVIITHDPLIAKRCQRCLKIADGVLLES